jgi:hypothetical protein
MGMFRPHWDSRVELLRRLRDLIVIAILAGLGAQTIASTEDLSTRILYAFAAVILIGLALWRSEWLLDGSRANLGAAYLFRS